MAFFHLFFLFPAHLSDNRRIFPDIGNDAPDDGLDVREPVFPDESHDGPEGVAVVEVRVLPPHGVHPDVAGVAAVSEVGVEL